MSWPKSSPRSSSSPASSPRASIASPRSARSIPACAASGPESLRHFKRSFKEALKRQIMLGQYDPDFPIIIPEKKDIRYRSWKEVKSPQSNALIVFMMDVSGSMGEEQKELVRLESFWIDTWLRKNYEGIESRYIVHDVSAKEVDKHTFYHLREDGGTKISSAFKTCKSLLDAHYSPDEWNIYLFHFSDGDNSSEADSRDCVKILKEQLIPVSNMFGYCQGRQRLWLGQLHQRPSRAPAQQRAGLDQPGQFQG